MKKLNITKETFEKSKYFTRKYGKLAFVSESGKLFKTSKGNILKFTKESLKREVMPMNGRKSFGHKAVEEEDDDGFTLFSYETPVAKLERREDGSGMDFTLLSDYLSSTTLTHIHSWLIGHNQKDIPTKELLQMNVGDSVPMMAAESKKLSKEAGRKVIPAENGCNIHDMGDCFVVTNKNGLNIGQCRTMIEAEDIAENADEYTKRKLGLESKKLVKEGAGAGYTVRIKDLKFGKILDKKYIEQKKKYESYHECKVEILPGEYEIEAEDYYNDFFWQEHEIGERAYAKIDGGVATIAYSCNSYDEDEADMELHNELENQKMDIAFGYGWGWVHADLPKDKPIESDHVDVEGREFYGSIDKIELNAPDLADAVNGGHQSIYDRDEEEEENLDDENEEYDDPSLQTMANELSESGDESIEDNEEDDSVGDGQWHVFDFGPDFDFYERFTVIAPDGYVFFIGSDGGVGSFEGERMSYSTSNEMCDVLATKDRKGNEVVPSELELSPNGISHDRIVSKGLTRIKDKYDYSDED